MLKTKNAKQFIEANLAKQNKEGESMDWKAIYEQTLLLQYYGTKIVPKLGRNSNLKTGQAATGPNGYTSQTYPKLFSENPILAATSVDSETDYEELPKVKPKRVNTANILMNDRVMTAAAGVTSYGVANLYNKGFFSLKQHKKQENKLRKPLRKKQDQTLRRRAQGIE